MAPATYPDRTIDIDNEDLRVSFCKVPWHFRGIAKDDYTPKFASLGPFHRNKPWLIQSMEHKKRYLTCLLRPSINQPTGSNQIITVDTLNEEITNLQISSSKSYPDLLEILSKEELVEMLVLDGCFVIQLVRFFNQGETHDPIFRTRWMVPTLWQDLLLLENQIPYSLVQKLFDLTAPLHEEASISMLILNFFGRHQSLQQTELGPADHLLGLLHTSYCSSVASLDPNSSYLEHYNMQSFGAAKLWEMGVGIEQKTNGDLLDLEYQNNILFIPRLPIDHSFIIAVRNFIAYEQCNRNVKPYFTSFAIFLDGLITSSKDVRLLCQMGIISHANGREEEIVNSVNSLTENVIVEVSNDYLSSLTRRMQDDLSKSFITWRRHRLHHYFPGALARRGITVTALVLFYLAIIQTVFTVLAFYQK